MEVKEVQIDGEGLVPLSQPPRVRVTVPARPDLLQLTNEVTTPFGIQHPKNTGTVDILLVGFGPNGVVQPAYYFSPGASESHWSAPEGATKIFTTSRVNGEVGGELEYDLPIS